MDLIQAINERHAVRHFDSKPINDDHKTKLLDLINKVNKEANLNLQLVINEPKAFGGAAAARCNFTGCVNYLALIGPKGPKLAEKAGYFGEQIVLFAQQLGINSCWVMLTYDKIPNTYTLGENDEILGVIALGYGTTQGHPHKSKDIKDVVVNKDNMPDWFINGVKMALLAPTGINQQGFMFELKDGNKVKLTNSSKCQDLDLGIVKYHFEIGAGKGNWSWE